MPMSWTPENDRLLLLKLIETQGISVDSNKIVAAWPDGSVKPTARAITERFVKLRQLAGLKGSVSSSGGTPSKPRTPCTSKYSTPKKRKTKHSSDESDVEDHFTDESPTKKLSVPRNAGTRGRGSARGGRCGSGGQIASSPTIRIKREGPANSVGADYDFAKHAAEAAEIRYSSEQDPFAGHPSSFQGFAPSSNGPRTLGGFGTNNDSTFNNTLEDPFSAAGIPANGHTEVTNRARSARKASIQASEGVAAFLQYQKDEDQANGDKSSAEDSQASEYHELDGGYI
ncbi:hypothetical protein BU23DRAFT_553119 [Bimuria novae-zelandiae CBS 107.79]|uniref:Uncharacterized protein n=1 Tax=Bimuria novae-zelandiae CBS 107.79 TaxID=1447943 RepID=A0A6A5VDV6_9PLEO|nr:hypothetical protein BU23DRAFT_553119 [Bimuria novae-zelandiae CBS 107.79]